MSERVLWIVPPLWGIGTAVLAAGLVALLVVSTRTVVLQRRAGRIRHRSMAALVLVSAVLVLMAAALTLFLLHDRVEFRDASFA